MNQELLKEITQGQIKAEKAAFKVGDGVRVHTKVRESRFSRALSSPEREAEYTKRLQFAAYLTAKA